MNRKILRIDWTWLFYCVRLNFCQAKTRQMLRVHLMSLQMWKSNSGATQICCKYKMFSKCWFCALVFLAAIICNQQVNLADDCCNERHLTFMQGAVEELGTLLAHCLIFTCFFVFLSFYIKPVSNLVYKIIYNNIDIDNKAKLNIILGGNNIYI